MTQQEALFSSLLRNEQRRPVDVNLGQVPITPTIGRMGNYSVVIRETPRDNAALELSRALSQLPQVIGQAKNLSVAAGLRQAQEMDLEEIEQRFSDGDTEAEGFMTWLGGNKAFQEAAYQRLFDANIKPRLQKVSSEIDGMTNGELLQFDSDESIKEYAQSRLVGSLEPGVLDTIKKNSWLAIRHNRAMEAIIPEYVQRASASIDARRRDFQEKEALAALETNFFTHADLDIEIPDFPDSAIKQMDSALAASQSAQYDNPNKAWKNNLQASIDFAVENGFRARLDKFQIEAKLMPALSAYFRTLLEDGKHSEADLFLELAESGSLNINGRPINKSTAGVRLIETAEELLESSLENNEEDFDQNKVDAYKLNEINLYNDARVSPDYNTEDYADYHRQKRAKIDELDYTVAEQLALSEFHSKEIARIGGSEKIYENFSNPEKDKKKAAFLDTYETISRVSLRPTITVEMAREASGLEPAVFDSLFLQQVTDSQGMGQLEGQMVFRRDVEPLLKNAAMQAESSTFEFYSDRPSGDLFLGSGGVNVGNAPNQLEFRGEVSEKAQEFLKEALGVYFRSEAKNRQDATPKLSEEDKKKQQTEDELTELEEIKFNESASDGGFIVDEEGKLNPTRTPYRSDVRSSSYSVGSAFDTRPRVIVPEYDLNKVNRTLANEFGRKAVKGNPVNKKLELINNMVERSGNAARHRQVGKRLSDVYKTDVFPKEVERELELVRHSGIPLSALIEKGGNVSGTYRTAGFFGVGADEKKYVIPYNMFDTFNKPEETKKRIFNMGAITKYINTGDDSDFKKIREIYLPSMPLDEFIKNQVTFFESLFGDITK